MTSEPSAAAGVADWARLDAALDVLLGLPAEQRDAAITRLAGDDAAMARTLRSMAAGLDGEDALLDQPAAQLLFSAPAIVAGLAPGTRLGPWRIALPIDRGGMGEVYRAERADGQFEQRVAIKLMRADAPQLLARFQAERQIVARLDHPGIARLLDGDVSPDGRPYMVMELVQGQQLMDWCREQACPLERRLELFDAICDAVAYAHRNLVVHRDIKPANVLVGADGRPKLLDFGIARLLDGPVGNATQESLLTPGYAAPEQLSGGPITTAADVYALGLLLHELLCGRPARAVQGLSLAAAMHQVLHADVQAPSRVARSEPAPPVPAQRIAGDLDAIVAKALRPEPEQRYLSVDALRADLERHRLHLPVQARRGSWSYVALRALRRHRGSAIAGALVLLVLLVGTAGVAWQAKVAREEAQRATSIQNFLLSLFRANTPEIARGRELSAKDLLAGGAKRLDDDLRSQPLALAKLHTELGDILTDMGELAPAREHLDRAIALYRQLGLEAGPEGTLALYYHANTLWLRGDLEAAAAEYRRVIELGAMQGPRPLLALKARQRLAFVLFQRGRLGDAIAMAEEGLAQPPGPVADEDQAQRLGLRHVIGLVLSDQGRFAQALQIQRATVADAASAPAVTVHSRFNYGLALARTLMQSGDFAQAVQQVDLMMPEMLRVLGPSADTTIKARQNMVAALSGLGRYEPALALARENLRWQIDSGSSNEAAVAFNRGIIGNLLVRSGRYDEAAVLLRETVAVLDRRYDKPTLNLEVLRRALGLALLGQGDLAGGTALIERSLNNLATMSGHEQMPDWQATLALLATARRLGGRIDEATELFDRACAGYQRSPGPESIVFARCQAEQTWLAAWRAPTDAAASARYDAAAQRYAARLAEGHPALADLALMRVELDERAGRRTPAARAAALAQWQRAFGRDWPGRLVVLH